MEPLDEAVDHVRGGAGRLLVEYGDHECPYSRQAYRQIERVEALRRYAEQLGLDLERFDTDRNGAGACSGSAATWTGGSPPERCMVRPHSSSTQSCIGVATTRGDCWRRWNGDAS